MSRDLWMFAALMAAPAAGAALCFLPRSARGVLRLVQWVGAGALAPILGVGWRVIGSGAISAFGGWLYLDALSAFHAAVLGLVFASSSLFAGIYFGEEASRGQFGVGEARRFGALWFGALAAMTMVLICGNLGLMWVGIEATTLLTAFLICVHVKPLALEAMWKYLMVCSVGVAFAFLGTLLVAAAAQPLNLDSSEMLVWSELRMHAALLDPATMKLAFVFLLVGYGAKAGLAPMHNWLPDAHSQAPGPVSALFSGFMLNAALYCIIRYLPLVEGAMPGAAWGRHLLVVFGILSILIAAAFVIFQNDAKRLLAYCSVEHIGIIALGLGLGGVGVFAALWHTLNHSLAKSLSFFAAGRMGQIYGTHDLRGMAGALRGPSALWGAGLFGSFLGLMAVAPFALFMSELGILRAAVDARSYVALGLFLAGAGIVFIGMLRHAMTMAWGKGGGQPRALAVGWLDRALVIGLLGILVVMGLWLPGPLRSVLESASRIIGGQP